MWFRWVLVTAAALIIGIVAWLSTHVSSEPAVFGRFSAAYSLMLAGFLLAGLALVLLAGPLFGSIKRFGGNTALFVSAIVVSLVIVELTVRIVDPLGISSYEHTLRYHLSKVPDDELFFRHPYNMRRIFGDVEVRTNSIGLRDRPLPNPSDGSRRILFLGDSVTFGVGVSEDLVFARRVEKQLNERGYASFRTFNSGVGGYNTDMEAAFLMRHGDLIDPDIVALLWVGNDTELTPTVRFDPWSDIAITGKSPPQAIRRLTGHSWTVRLIRHIVTYSSATGFYRLDTSQPGWQASVASVQRVNEWCEERGVPFVLVVLRYSPGGILDDVVANFRSLAENQGFRFADSLPWWEGHEIRDYTNSVVDSHPNAVGHKILADGLVTLLMDENLL